MTIGDNQEYLSALRKARNILTEGEQLSLKLINQINQCTSPLIFKQNLSMPATRLLSKVMNEITKVELELSRALEIKPKQLQKYEISLNFPHLLQTICFLKN